MSLCRVWFSTSQDYRLFVGSKNFTWVPGRQKRFCEIFSFRKDIQVNVRGVRRVNTRRRVEMSKIKGNLAVSWKSSLADRKRFSLLQILSGSQQSPRNLIHMLLVTVVPSVFIYNIQIRKLLAHFCKKITAKKFLNKMQCLFMLFYSTVVIN